jgi:hypothetical protein
MSGPEDEPEDIHGECAAENATLRTRCERAEAALARDNHADAREEAGRLTVDKARAAMILRRLTPWPTCGCGGFYGPCIHRHAWEWLAANYPPSGFADPSSAATPATKEPR